MRSLSCLIFSGVLASIAGCSDSKTIWSNEVQSPDKLFLASAQTEQYSGPGSAGVYTTVYLKQGANKKIMILTLENGSAYPSGITNVDMKWITPSHLSIDYKGHAAIDFQAVKCSGVEISVEQEG